MVLIFFPQTTSQQQQKVLATRRIFFNPFLIFARFFFCSLRIYAFKEKKRKVHLHSLWKKNWFYTKRDITREKWVVKKEMYSSSSGGRTNFILLSFNFFFYKLKTKMTATIFSFQSFKLYETRQFLKWFFDTKNHFFKEFLTR